MTGIVFVSDLHLSQEHPATTGLFLRFLGDLAHHTNALYILGDLFEYWAGDDDIHDPHHSQVIAAMRALADSGTALYLMHGNRDFLMGSGFAQASGVRLLPDPTMIAIGSKRALLTHGDLLCTDDQEYQAFRSQVRQQKWQQDFLAQPLAQRKAQIAALRNRSEQEKSAKDAYIMDVNTEAVHDLLRQHGYPDLLIHGHTHRPARHPIKLDGKACERIVLADWGDAGSCLECCAEGCRVREIR